MHRNKLIVKSCLSIFFLVLAVLSFGGISTESCLSVGTRQYKPSGSCSTQSRICCGNGYFSGWGESCPSSFDCDESQKPSISQACSGGTQTRTVYCDTSKGKWIENAWSECQCYNGYTKCNGSCMPSPFYDDDLYGGGPAYSSQWDANSACPSYCERVSAKELVGGTGYANDTRCSNNAAPSQPCGCGAPVVCYTTAYSSVQRGGNKYYCECLLASYRCP